MRYKGKLIRVAVITAVVALLLVPLVTKNHIYNSVTMAPDATNTFMPIINEVVNGASFSYLAEKTPYLGLTITLWCLSMLVKVLQVSPHTLFMIYALVTLFGVGITFYCLGKLLGGKRTGCLVVVFALLCNTSILGLFAYALIFNIINVYIIFLWAVIAGIKWQEKHHWYWLALSCTMLLLFITMHPTGVYLFCALLVAGVSFVVWHLCRYRKINWLYVGIGLVATALVVGLASGVIELMAWRIPIELMAWRINDWGEYRQYLVASLYFILQPVPTVIWILTLVGFLRYRKTLEWSRSVKLVIAILGSIVAVLLGASFLWVIEYTDRLMVDAGAMLSIIVAIVLGQLIKRDELKWLKVSSYALFSLAGLMTLQRWVV